MAGRHRLASESKPGAYYTASPGAISTDFLEGAKKKGGHSDCTIRVLAMAGLVFVLGYDTATGKMLSPVQSPYSQRTVSVTISVKFIGKTPVSVK